MVIGQAVFPGTRGLVVIGQAVFPGTRGYVHFQFHDYAKLTVIGSSSRHGRS